MRVIKREPLRLFAVRWPDAKGPLDVWYRHTVRAEWTKFTDVKATFGQTDQARVSSGNTVVIFDIAGNKYRLITAISDRKGKVYVLRIMTHKEYDRNLWKAQL